MADLSMFHQRYGLPLRGMRLSVLLLLAAAAVLPAVSTPARADEPAAQNAPAEPEDKRSQLYIMNADGSNLRLLVQDESFDYTIQGSPDWTADGTKVAFDAWKVGEGTSDARIFVVDADGKNVQDLGPGAMPDWSPRAKRLCFSQYDPNRGVWVMDADGSNRVLLDPAGWCARWSPNGHMISCTITENGGDIVMYDLIEGERRLLFGDNRPYQYIYWNYSWSPDSKRLSFRAQRGEKEYDFVIASAEGASRGLDARTFENFSNTSAWDPTGQQIAISMHSQPRKRQQIFLLDPTSQKAPLILSGQPADRHNTGAVWSPDGKQIVFASRKGK